MACWTLGLDLGQARDYSALVAAERVQKFWPVDEAATFEYAPDRPLDAYWQNERLVYDEYHVRHLLRWELGTPYDAVVGDVADLMQAPEFERRAVLAFDRTGVGGGIADMFTAAYRQGKLGDVLPQGYSLTAGYSAKGSPGGKAASARTIHKGDLVGRLLLLNEADRIRLPLGLPAAEQLQKELRGFTLKQSERTGAVTYEAATQGVHDDFVIALALAVWLRHNRGVPRFINGETGTLCERA